MVLIAKWIAGELLAVAPRMPTALRSMTAKLSPGFGRSAEGILGLVPVRAKMSSLPVTAPPMLLIPERGGGRAPFSAQQYRPCVA